MNKEYLTESEYKGQPGYKEVWQYQWHPAATWMESNVMDSGMTYEEYKQSNPDKYTRRIYVPIEAPLPAASEQGEELTIEHLAPYLPYTTQLCSFYEGCTTVLTGKMLTDKYFTRYFIVSKYKPILRPMSDLATSTMIAVLCKEALNQIWGHFDFDFIIKSYHTDGDRYGIVAESDDLRIGFSVNFESQKDFKLTIDPIGSSTQGDLMLDKLALFNWLFKEKFDVFGLIDKGLAIDINTL